MDISPQLEFNGQCRQAFDWYASVFGGTIEVMNTMEDTKDVPLPPGSTDGGRDMVRFAELRLGEQTIRGNDVPSDQYQKPGGFNLSVHFETATEARKVFDKLMRGGSVTTAPTQVAWAALFAMGTDKFGVPWLFLGFR